MQLNDETGALCHCAKYAYDSRRAPLSWEVLLFFNIIKQWATHCALAGGAVLAEIVYQSRQCQGCSSPVRWKMQQHTAIGDVDFFVPVEPNLVRKFYKDSRGSDKDGGDKRSFPQLLRDEVLPSFNAIMGKKNILGELKIRKTITCEKKDQEGGQRKEHRYNIHGISSIFELEFESRADVKKLQIICLHSLPEYVGESWESSVVRKFDIDIVKNIATTDPCNPLFPQVKFDNPSALESFQGGNFVYTIQPCAQFAVTFNRIRKYIKRGFYLKELKFDTRVTPFWKQTFIDQFSSVFCKAWAEDMLQECVSQSSATDTLAEQKEKEHLIHAFKGHSELAPIIASFIWKPLSRWKMCRMKCAQRAVESHRQLW
jgi:hypothetical protein